MGAKRTREVAASKEMKEFYYYERDIERRPIKAFCIIEIGDKFGKGISIYSKKNQPEKKAGITRSVNHDEGFGIGLRETV